MLYSGYVLFPSDLITEDADTLRSLIPPGTYATITTKRGMLFFRTKAQYECYLNKKNN